jgi:hypothetical protein
MIGLQSINPIRDHLNFSGKANATSTTASITRSVGVLSTFFFKGGSAPEHG